MLSIAKRRVGAKDRNQSGTCRPEELHERLQAAAITHLLFTDVTTKVCVQTSMREANDRGHTSLMVEDATESYFPALKNAVDMITAQDVIVGWSTSSALLLTTLPAAA